MKGQIVSKFDLGLLNAYKSMYFDRNIIEKGSYLSSVTNDEFHFKVPNLYHIVASELKIEKINKSGSK